MFPDVPVLWGWEKPGGLWVVVVVVVIVVVVSVVALRVAKVRMQSTVEIYKAQCTLQVASCCQGSIASRLHISRAFCFLGRVRTFFCLDECE